jgi:hypothetical protein
MGARAAHQSHGFVRVLSADGDAKQFEPFAWDPEWADLEISAFIAGRLVRYLVPCSYVKRGSAPARYLVPYERDARDTRGAERRRELRARVCREYVATLASPVSDTEGLESWLRMLEAYTRVDASVLAQTGGIQVRGVPRFTLKLGRAGREGQAGQAGQAGRAGEASAVLATAAILNAETRERVCSSIELQDAEAVEAVGAFEAFEAVEAGLGPSRPVEAAEAAAAAGAIARIFRRLTAGLTADVPSIEHTHYAFTLSHTKAGPTIHARARRTCVLCSRLLPASTYRVLQSTDARMPRLPFYSAVCTTCTACTTCTQNAQKVELWGVSVTMSPLTTCSLLARPLAVVAVEWHWGPFLEHSKRTPRWRQSPWQRRACLASYAGAILTRASRNGTGAIRMLCADTIALIVRRLVHLAMPPLARSAHATEF